MLKNYISFYFDFNFYYSNLDLIGTVFWPPWGFFVFKEIKNYIRYFLYFCNYYEVKSPILISCNLLKISTHIDNYFKNIFFVNFSKFVNFAIKPLNCPNHIILFKKFKLSQADLPLRFSEFSSCFRNELSGSILTLIRLREFTQDDGHIFCLFNQIFYELKLFNSLIFDIYNNFKFFNIFIKFSLRSDIRKGSNFLWNISENKFRNFLITSNLKWTEILNDSAFYGPKLEYHIKDKFGRFWQCGTIQLDLILPQLFILNFNNVVILHRAFLGSIERFIGLFIENNYFIPSWLSFIQIYIFNISFKSFDYSKFVYNKLKFNKFRISLDLFCNNFSNKIKKYSLFKIPYIFIIGDFEYINKSISIRFNKEKIILNLSLNKIIIFIYRDILLFI